MLYDIGFRQDQALYIRKLALQFIPVAFNNAILSSRLKGDAETLVRISSDPTLPHTICAVAGGYAAVAFANSNDLDGLARLRKITRGGDRQYCPLVIREYAVDIADKLRSKDPDLKLKILEIETEMKDKMKGYLARETRKVRSASAPKKKSVALI